VKWRLIDDGIGLVFLGMVVIALAFALLLTRVQIYDCDYDDQLMFSDGTCVNLDTLLDTYNERNLP